MYIRLLFVVLLVGILFVNQGDCERITPGKDEIVFDSMAGMALLREARLTKSGLSVLNHITTQNNLGSCGLASISAVLNAMEYKRTPVPPEYMYFNGTDEIAFRYNTIDQLTWHPCVRKTVGYRVFGYDMSAMTSIIQCMGLRAVPYYASKYPTVQSFEQELNSLLAQEDSYIIANIDRPGLEEVGGGHYSPLGFSAHGGRYLFLDVSRYKYPFTWVRGIDLFNAMGGIDKKGGKSRGFIVIYKESDSSLRTH